MIRHYWLCLDVRGFSACSGCLRNPERPENREADRDPAQAKRMPLARAGGCADHLEPRRNGSMQRPT